MTPGAFPAGGPVGGEGTIPGVGLALPMPQAPVEPAVAAPALQPAYGVMQSSTSSRDHPRPPSNPYSVGSLVSLQQQTNLQPHQIMQQLQPPHQNLPPPPPFPAMPAFPQQHQNLTQQIMPQNVPGISGQPAVSISGPYVQGQPPQTSLPPMKQIMGPSPPAGLPPMHSMGTAGFGAGPRPSRMNSQSASVQFGNSGAQPTTFQVWPT